MTTVLLLFSLLLTALFYFIDGYAAFLTIFLTFIVGLTLNLKVKGDKDNNGLKLFLVVFVTYVTLSYVYSVSFVGGNYFSVSDPARYLEKYLNSDRILYDSSFLSDCYFNLADNNALYHLYLNYVASFANNYLDGATVFFMTMVHTFWGICFSSILYRIILIYKSSKESFKYVLVFSLCSQVLFYSCLIIRDIMIVFTFCTIVNIILRPFKIYNLLFLFLLMFIAWGLRLFSGLFCGVFILLYIYNYVKGSKLQIIALPLYCVALVFVTFYALGSGAVDQSLAEINVYSVFTLENEMEKGGLFVLFYDLPSGLKEISVLLYSQMSPFPSYLGISSIRDFSSFAMVVSIIVYELWWFFVFYTILYSFIMYKSYNFLTRVEKLLVFMAIVFIIANTAHPDIRRMLPVYPILYIYYIKVRAKISLKTYHKMIRHLAIFYCLLLLVYLLVKV